MVEGKNKGGRPPLLNEEHSAVLRAITTAQPRSSLGEVTNDLGRRTGMNVCTSPSARHFDKRASSD